MNWDTESLHTASHTHPDFDVPLNINGHLVRPVPDTALPFSLIAVGSLHRGST